MNGSPDLLVAGGGIAGLATALAAADRGLSVCVVDEGRPGAASRAAAGMLAPSVEGLPPEVRVVAIEARDLYPTFVARLRERSDVDVPLDRNGILELASSPSEFEDLVSQTTGDAQLLDERALARLEPAFAGHAGALLHPLDGSIDNVVLMQALEAAVERAKRIHRISGSVVELHFAKARPITRLDGGERIASDRVVLAAGAWATGVAGLPRPLPVRPLRGQLLRLDRVPIRHVTYGAGGYLVPRGGSLLVGATTEDTGYENSTTDDGLAALRAIARSAIPDLERASVLEHWAGLRPITPDTLPILGADPDCPALVYACGFSRNGILLAPWAAAQLAPILFGEPATAALAMFSPTRFGNIS